MRLNLTSWLNKIKYDPNSVKREFKDASTDVYLVLLGNLTYDKFYYLVRDIGISAEYVTSLHDTITYNTGNSQSFALYRGGLAVASREKMSVFSASGKELISTTYSYANPILISSGKYMLLYDAGGRSFSMVDSFSEIIMESVDEDICGASISLSGDFALITKSNAYSSTIRYYSKNSFEYEYNYASGYVISVSLSSNGSKMAVVLLEPNGSNYRVQIRLYNVGSNEYLSADISKIGFPLAIKITDGNNVIAVGTKGVSVFSQALLRFSEYISECEIYSYSFSDDSIAIAHVLNDGKNEVIVFNQFGKVEKKLCFENKIIEVAMCNKYLILQKINGFEKIDTTLGIKKEIKMNASNMEMLVMDKNTIVVCEGAYARFLNFD